MSHGEAATEDCVRFGTGSAGGKVILLGEHAVVYGVPGLAAGIDRGASARATLRPGGGESRLALGGAEVVASDAEQAPELARALSALLRAGAQGGAALAIEAEAELPPGGGLGCSAALGVAIARAVEEALGAPSDEVELEARLLRRASAWEGVFHGNPSGIDTAAALTGGYLRFVRGEGATRVASKHELWLAVGHSGASASTRAMVEQVARLGQRRPAQLERFLASVAALVDRAEAAIASGDAAELGKLFDLNQMLLAGLMLSTETLEAMCASARSRGALGAKLTGSGGGGAVIALAGAARPGDAAEVEEARALAEHLARGWADQGHAAFVTRIRSLEQPR